MADRDDQFAELYRDHRLAHQRRYYAARKAEYEAAERQGARVSGALLTVASGAGWLAVVELLDAAAVWGAVGAAAAALATALVSFRTLYSFERLAKLYEDAARSLSELERREPVDPAVVVAAEDVMSREQGQWGQLVADLPLAGGEP